MSEATTELNFCLLICSSVLTILYMNSIKDELDFSAEPVKGAEIVHTSQSIDNEDAEESNYTDRHY